MRHLAFALVFVASVLGMGNAQNPQTLYIETFAGNGIAGFTGDGGRATSAEIQWPSQIVLDRTGNIYFADNLNNRIRVINTQSTTQTLLNVSVCSGCIETVAGNGGLGFGGDGGPARDAMLAHPVGMGIDSAGNIYVADQQNHRIREITTEGVITTVVGSGAWGNHDCSGGSYSGDGGPATSATLNCPQGVTIDSSGNIYVADSDNLRIRAVNVQTTTQTILGVSIGAGDIQTVGGTGGTACSTSGRAATSSMGVPLGLGLDSSGNLYEAAYNCNRILEITTAGLINLIAGNGSAGYSGDGFAATRAELNSPFDVKVDSLGDVFIADAQNNLIREIRYSTGDINTVAGDYSVYGTQGGYGGDGHLAILAGLSFPIGIALVPNSTTFYIGDLENNRVREVTKSPVRVD